MLAIGSSKVNLEIVPSFVPFYFFIPPATGTVAFALFEDLGVG
jgi:hypothetical protein